MFSFVQRWLANHAHPIGVDFGSDCLRMAQVQWHDGEPKLIAAASADVPHEIQNDAAARHKFFATTARELVRSHNFQGSDVILALPASIASIHCMAAPCADVAVVDRFVSQTIATKLKMNSDDLLVRHFAAGEELAESRSSDEVIAIAAARSEVNRLLDAARKAHLQVVGMNVQPRAVIDCFSHVFQRQSDKTSTTCFIDVGASGTRVVVAHRSQILGAARIAIGGADFNQAAASAMSLSVQEARLARMKLSHSDAQLEDRRDKRELHTVRPQHLSGDLDEQRKAITSASEPLISELVRHLQRLCAHVVERFPHRPVDRLVFIGGEARSRSLCRSIAQSMGISAVVGDPLLRMGKSCDIGFESGMDRREPQPCWVTAIGLSLGRCASEVREPEKTSR